MISTILIILIILYLVYLKLETIKNKRIKFILSSQNASRPIRGTPKSAGYDLTSAEDCIIAPRSHKAVETGIKVVLPPKTYGRVASRSGLSFKNGIEVGAGVIDEDYSNTIKVILHNHSDEEFMVKTQDRIAQFIVENVVYPLTFVEDKNGNVQFTDDYIRNIRGKGGFGSTGVN